MLCSYLSVQGRYGECLPVRGLPVCETGGMYMQRWGVDHVLGTVLINFMFIHMRELNHYTTIIEK